MSTRRNFARSNSSHSLTANAIKKQTIRNKRSMKQKQELKKNPMLEKIKKQINEVKSMLDSFVDEKRDSELKQLRAKYNVLFNERKLNQIGKNYPSAAAFESKLCRYNNSIWKDSQRVRNLLEHGDSQYHSQSSGSRGSNKIVIMEKSRSISSTESKFSSSSVESSQLGASVAN